MNYDVDYFIKKFEAIPENKWTTGAYMNNKGQSCALGHCGIHRSVPISQEPIELSNLFIRKLGISVLAVNDFKLIKWGSTPKERILNALKEIKANEKS
jgi:hypothetical protein